MTTTLIATKAEALSILRRQRNAKFFLHARADADIIGDSSTYLPGGFRGSAHLTRKAAIGFIESCFSESMERRGAGIAVTVDICSTGVRHVWIG